MLQRVGFEKYGEDRSYMHIAGEWQDNVLYQLLTPTPERVVTYRKGRIPIGSARKQGLGSVRYAGVRPVTAGR